MDEQLKKYRKSRGREDNLPLFGIAYALGVSLIIWALLGIAIYLITGELT